MEEPARQAFRWMLLARTLEEKIANLFRGGKITGGVFQGRGQEALSVSIGMTLSVNKGDVFAPLIRDMAGRLAFGMPILDATRTYLGSAKGPMRARDGNVHVGRPREGTLAMISHLGAMISVTVGTLMAKRFRGKTGAVGATCIGDGATSTGSFHEALNMAAVERLPLVLIVANNQFAYSTPNDREFACEKLVDRAAGYGVAGHEVRGNDLEACLRTLDKAVGAARNGGGPQLIVAELLRLCGHGEHDDALYVTQELKESPIGRDCLEVATELLFERGWADEEKLKEWERTAADEVEKAIAQAQREPGPDPYEEEWCALSTRRLCEGIDRP